MKIYGVACVQFINDKQIWFDSVIVEDDNEDMSEDEVKGLALECFRNGLGENYNPSANTIARVQLANGLFVKLTN